MNQHSDEMYTIIKNDNTLLETFFAGLHRIARLSLNYKPKSAFGKGVLLFGWERPTPADVALPHTNAYICFTSNFIDAIYNAMAALGYDAEERNEVRQYAVNAEPLQALVDEFWDDMLHYAKTNARYNSHWIGKAA